MRKSVRPTDACQITSSFSISSDDLDPNECTEALGITPHRTGLKGTKLHAESYGVLQTSFWSVGPYKMPSDDIDDGMSEVLNLIWPRRTRVLEYLQQTGFLASFVTVVNIYESRPLYRLRPQTLQSMAFFGVEYIFDIHDYSE